jgi:hypothetical protein
LSNVPFDALQFSVNARLDNFAGQMNIRPATVSRGSVTITGDQRALTIAGTGRANNSDVNLRWTETLRGPPETASRYQISGTFRDEDLIALGFPVAKFADGLVGVNMTGQGHGFDVANADINIDLAQAAVTAPFAFFTKRVGPAASVRFDLAKQRDGSLLLSNINARGAGLNATGSLRVAASDGRILEADIPRLQVQGRSDARIIARTAASDGGIEINVRGPLFDGAPFMDPDPTVDHPAPGTPAAAAQAAAAPAVQPLRASVVVDRLKLRGGATLQGANVDLSMARNAILRMSVTGQAPAAKAFNLSLGPQPGDTRSRVRFNTEDAGFAVRALLGTENVVGGAAHAEGDWRAGPPSQANIVLTMNDFSVVDMPVMARLLQSTGSLTGFVEMLNGDGIKFHSLRAPITYTERRITIGETRISGNSIGLTASGAYDIPNDNLDIDGVVVPFFGINSLLGHVPVLGSVLTGRRGEGVIGVNFSMNGPVADARVGVNPLSVITPGILRRIFDPFTSRARPDPAAQTQGASPPAAAAPTPAAPADPQPAAP